jgi:hypothetical protein
MSCFQGALMAAAGGSVLEELFSRDHKEKNKNKKMIVALEPFDVLCGKGKPIQKHPGNKLLRLLIDQNCHRYNKAPRLERRAIANEIVQGIKCNVGKLPGRFLRFCESAEEVGWREVSDAASIDKVSHCFRARRNLGPEISSSFSEGGSSLVVSTMITASATKRYGFVTPSSPRMGRQLINATHQEGLSNSIAASPQVTKHSASDEVINGAGNNIHLSSSVVGVLLGGPRHAATSSSGLLTHLYKQQEERHKMDESFVDLFPVHDDDDDDDDDVFLSRSQHQDSTSSRK